MKINLEKIRMKEADPQERAKTFSEVALGYTEEQALNEAQRCIQCKNPTCVQGCPVEINIPLFIKHITEKQFSESLKVIKQKNNLPAICGRVCPQEKQCQLKCIIGKKGAPVSIGSLERFVSDCEVNKETNSKSEIRNPDTLNTNSHKIAIAGSGPAGLTCAGDLARDGFDVTVYEALHASGGVLRYGIPPFRLPRKILDFEVNYLKSIGVKFLFNTLIGATYTIPDLFNMGYKSVFIGSGAGLPVFPKIPGENLCRIYSANEFLTRINLMNTIEFPKFDTPINIGSNIVTIGGGNTAMDSARCALRLINASRMNGNSTILYRRTESEMPARKDEIEHAKQEGIKFMFLIQPIRFISDDKGYVTGIECLKCELGEPDSSGRRKPVPVKGSEFVYPCDTVVLALGLNPNPLIPKFTPEIKTNKWGDIIVDQETMETSMPNVYAGGDIVGGEGTVIEAMGMGKKAAKSIKKKLT